MLDVISTSAEQTREVGRRLGTRLRLGDVVLLHGDLGAGKTTFAQGVGRGLGVVDAVQSPTFTIVNEHETAAREVDRAIGRFYHLDLYRLAGDGDLDSFGFDDYLAPDDGVAVVEWPERAAARLPETFLLVRLDHLGEGKRRLVIEPVPETGPYAARLAGLGRELAGGRDP